MSRRASRVRRPLRHSYRPALEGLEDRTAPSASWFTFAGDPQHSGMSTVPAQPVDSIHWQTPVDLNPTGAFVHYGSPVFTQANTAIIPVKTGAAEGFEVAARNGASGALIWTLPTDYTLPPHGWLPPYGPSLTSAGRLYFPGRGGTVYYVDNPDSPGATISGQLAFYGIENYRSNPAAYDASVFIDTPITADNNGNIYFGFMVTGSNPSNLVGGGIARIDANGNGSYILAATAVPGGGVTRVPLSAAPALSHDGATLYTTFNNTGQYGGYLVGLDSTSLVPRYRVALKDPRQGQANAGLIDSSTATPFVAPDDTVFISIFGNPYNGSRGFLLHFSADLATSFTPGAFGWDDTPSIVPASAVPSYHGTSPYLIFSKYNNYVTAEVGSSGGDGVNQIAILDPYDSQLDTRNDGDPNLRVMREVLTAIGPTPDEEFINRGFPNAVREWCINDSAIDPFTKSALVNSEDGNLYRWDLTTNTFTKMVNITPGIGEPYTPTSVGPDGTVYVINGGTLFALGGLLGYTLDDVSSLNPAAVGQSVTFTVTAATANGGPIPTGTIAFKDDNIVLAMVPLVNGQASLTTSFSTAAAHFITASYSGDGSHPAGDTTLVELVRQGASSATLVSSGSPALVGTAVTFTAAVVAASGTGVPRGTVTFLDGSTLLGYGALNAAGQATFTTSSLTPGRHGITVSYAGDLSFSPSVSSVLQQVIQNPTSTTGSASPSPALLGQSVTLTATVGPVVNGILPTGFVDFKEGNTVLGTAPLLNVGGVATASFPTAPLQLAVGDHTIQAVYGSDDRYAASMSPGFPQVVNTPTTTTTVTSSANPSSFGQALNFTATVATVFPSSVIPTGSVQFRVDGGVPSAPVPLDASGQATFSPATGLGVGNHSIGVVYLPTGVFFTSSGSLPNGQTVNPAPTASTVATDDSPSVYGQTVTFTATVVAPLPSGGTPTGVVDFLIDGVAVATQIPLTAGQAQYQISSLPVAGSPHNVSVNYSNVDGNFQSGSGTLSGGQTVTRADTVTRVDSSQSPSEFGQAVTFTATVTTLTPGAVTATGPLTFVVDGIAQSPPVNLTNGQASWTTSGLSVVGSPHTITAQFGGSDNLNPSLDTLASGQVVRRAATQTTITADNTPSSFGQPVVFTASVSRAGLGDGTPGGSVAFFVDGVRQSPDVLLGSGLAAFRYDGLTIGAHSITVTYLGDDNFDSSSASLAPAQTVVAASTLTTVTSSANPSAFGLPVTFTAAVRTAWATTPDGSVTFLLDDVAVPGVYPLQQGRASFTAPTLTVGSHTVQAAYAGTDRYAGSNGSLVPQQSVQRAGTSTLVVSSNLTATFGQPVTFTATVSPVVAGTGTATGTVTFLVDGVAASGTVVMRNGQATWTTRTIGVPGSPHNVRADYAGDANFAESSGSLDRQVILKAGTTTALGSPRPTPPAGRVLQFVATVVGVAGLPAPPGTVTFSVDGTPRQPVALDSTGRAVLSVALNPGIHTLMASYNGSANHIGSTATLTQRVLTLNQSYIAQLYRDLLRREADAGGLQRWSGLLDSGTPRQAVVTGILSSTEYLTLQVNQLYQAYFGRPADPAGLATWLQVLTNITQFAPPGTNPVEFVKAQLLGSPEYFQRHGSTNQGFLTAIYLAVLERPIDPPSLAGWNAQLNSGASRVGVARAILASTEAQQVLVIGMYRHFLHREPDPSGLARWVSVLLTRRDQNAVIIGLVTSTEYLNHL